MNRRQFLGAAAAVHALDVSAGDAAADDRGSTHMSNEPAGPPGSREHYTQSGIGGLTLVEPEHYRGELSIVSYPEHEGDNVAVVIDTKYGEANVLLDPDDARAAARQLIAAARRSDKWREQNGGV